MKPIGGFFEVEQERDPAQSWHQGALTLTSGRACLRAILETVRPSRVFLPFYICDSAVEPVRRLGIPLEFYPLTQALDPERTSWPADALVLYVNYFDVKNARAAEMSGSLGRRAVIDDTQAFFRRARGRSYSFNSARKFFGVPDGAYAYGPGLEHVHPSGANEKAAADHLITRARGEQDLAYRQYIDAESRVSSELLAPSPMTARVLARIPYDEVRLARRRNFAALHDRLSAVNTLPIVPLDADAAPFCYPFLPSRPAAHEALWRRGIFVPRLWPEIAARAGAGFSWEKDLAARLLPLPVDHRYGSVEMQRVGDAVSEVSG